MRDLRIDNYPAYRAHLEADPSEWQIFDACCHITISRFFRDRRIFEVLRSRVLPDIAVRAQRESREVRIWSAGCASGEEQYTLKILWDVELTSAYPDTSVRIIASDVDNGMLERAREGCFEATSLHELPPSLIEQAFDRPDRRYCVKPEHREGIEFLEQDVRTSMPSYVFDLILCRYVAFTYFTEPLQLDVLANMLERLRPGGYLVIGTHEHLPSGVPELVPLDNEPQVFQKSKA